MDDLKDLNDQAGSNNPVNSKDLEVGFSRRSMLGRMALLVGAGATGLTGLSGCATTDHSQLVDQLVQLSPDRESAAAIGQAFLEQTSTNTSRLAARLAEELDWQPDLDTATLATRLLERIERDFRDGRTVQVQSWVLAQTEAWWAAVVALA